MSQGWMRLEPHGIEPTEKGGNRVSKFEVRAGLKVRVALLVLGLFSFGWVAMAAYVIAGPDSTRPAEAARGIAAEPGG